jgi:hypothetical protein
MPVSVRRNWLILCRLTSLRNAAVFSSIDDLDCSDGDGDDDDDDDDG